MGAETNERAAANGNDLAPGELVANRFRIEALLGRGGTGGAYRVRDEVTGRSVALKLLDVPNDAKRAQQLIEQFEREFHALTDLAHPRVVQVWDYGLWDRKPFYTLELLDGGDVQALAPLPWQDVCSIAYDVCSALSLLHSRRLVHRDVTPRNIRRTAGGKAKLIDFGLLSPMGVASVVAGTPPFVAPEVVQRGALDARCDLFSLGCTLYFALTGRVCFPARTFAQLPELWAHTPVPPSDLVAGIPKPVDDLVAALMRIDVASRLKSAAEVMERLEPLLSAAPDEELSAARSYLSTPQLVGRDSVVAAIRERLATASLEQGGGILIAGEPGVGRSRIINAFVLEAKLFGATTLRASAIDAAAGPFGVAAALATDLLAAHPATAQSALEEDPGTFSALFEGTQLELRIEPTRSDTSRLAIQTALRAWFLRAAQEHNIAIAVDDIDQIDEPSAALLATLSWDAPRCRIAYAVSVSSQTRYDSSQALSILSQHARLLELKPLAAVETYSLLASVFGEVPHLHLLSHRLFDIAAGRPRDVMALAQHLVDTGTIRYAGGSWTLPEELPEGLLPAHMEDALERRLAALSPVSQRLGLQLSLSLLERLPRSHWLRLEGTTSAEIDRAIDELRANQLITGTTAGYALCHASYAELFTSHASASAVEQAHRDLAAIFDQVSESAFVIAHHYLHGDRTDAAFERLSAVFADPAIRIREIDRAEAELGTNRAASAFLLAFRAAERQGRPIAELQMWRAMIAGMSARGADTEHYYGVAREWLAQIKREVVPSEAIRQLIGYVVMSIAVAVRSLDLELQRSLPPLLEPYAPLSPLVEAMWWNARATCLNGVGKREEARALFVKVLDRIAELAGNPLAYLDKIRAAIQQTIAEIDASTGVRSSFITRLDDPTQDPNQRVGGHYIKKVLALNEGDWQAAERHRRDAELLSLQTKARSMFSTLGQELEAHALARDLTGLKQVRASIAAMAAQSPGWLPVLCVADAHYRRSCGDLQGALSVAASLRDAPEWQRASPWCLQARALEAELLTELQRPQEAFALCEPAWSHCQREGMAYFARALGCSLTLVEAALGRFEHAMARIDGIIAELMALGVSGLQLGRAHECAARVAIAKRDRNEFKHRAALVAVQYKSKSGSVQGLAYEYLLEDARRAGVLTQIEAEPASATREVSSKLSRASQLMTGSDDRDERAHRAVDLLCEATQASAVHLFLSTSHGLELVASSADSVATDSFADAARSIFDSQLAAENDAATVAFTQVEEELGAAGRASTLASNERRDAVVLRAYTDGIARTVGVAILVEPRVAGRADVMSVATIVATHLVRFCDEQPRMRNSHV